MNKTAFDKKWLEELFHERYNILPTDMAQKVLNIILKKYDAQNDVIAKLLIDNDGFNMFIECSKVEIEKVETKIKELEAYKIELELNLKARANKIKELEEIVGEFIEFTETIILLNPGQSRLYKVKVFRNTIKRKMKALEGK